MVCILAVSFSFASSAFENSRLIDFDLMVLQISPLAAGFSNLLLDCSSLPDQALCKFYVYIIVIFFGGCCCYDIETISIGHASDPEHIGLHLWPLWRCRPRWLQATFGAEQ
jgi:hypothetical protein